MSKVVAYPHWRAELIHHLENMRSARVRFEWSTKPYASKTLHHIKFVSNFIFDTMGIDENPQGLVGLVFFDEAELVAVAQFSKALRSLLDRNDETDAAVLSDPDWPEVMSIAQDALRVLRSKERH